MTFLIVFAKKDGILRVNRCVEADHMMKGRLSFNPGIAELTVLGVIRIT